MQIDSLPLIVICVALVFDYINGFHDAAGYLKGLTKPTWVIFAAHGAIALGTMSGGWWIVRTMGGRLTRLKPRSGFCAETGAAFSVLLATGYFHSAGVDHARDRRSHRRRGRHQSCESRSVGSRGEYR